MQQLVVTNIGPTGTFGLFIFKVGKPATCLLLVTQLLTLTESTSIYGGRIWTDTPYTYFLGLFLHNRVFTDCPYSDNSLLYIGAPALVFNLHRYQALISNCSPPIISSWMFLISCCNLFLSYSSGLRGGARLDAEQGYDTVVVIYGYVTDVVLECW